MTETTSIKDRVLKALERVRPYLQSDGGDIEFIDVTDDMTVKVEQAIMKEVPEIKRVISA
jgi:Fe-S cluster biogenesis protein NfuA